MSGTGGSIERQDEGALRLLRIARPARRNALNASMYRDLADALETLGAEDGSPRVALLSGQGEAFCAGNDLDDFLAVDGDGKLPLDEGSPQARLLRTLAGLEAPLVVAVDGAAIGIGCTLLLHADIVVATPEASLGVPFVPLGVCPEAGSSQALPALLGRQRAMEMFLLGRRLGAEEALAAGLVNRVVASEALAATARGYAEALAALPPHAVAATKRLVAAPPESAAARVERELPLFRDCLGTEATQGLIRAARDSRRGRDG